MSSILIPIKREQSGPDDKHESQYFNDTEAATSGSVEAVMQRVEDGFSRLCSQLEALNLRLTGMSRVTDKVDMLEASVRLLENHALVWGPATPTSDPAPSSQQPRFSSGLSPTSSLSSSSLHSSALPYMASPRWNAAETASTHNTVNL